MGPFFWEGGRRVVAFNSLRTHLLKFLIFLEYILLELLGILKDHFIFKHLDFLYHLENIF